jgi:hypothetical protein
MHQNMSPQVNKERISRTLISISIITQVIVNIVNNNRDDKLSQTQVD